MSNNLNLSDFVLFCPGIVCFEGPTKLYVLIIWEKGLVLAVALVADCFITVFSPEQHRAKEVFLLPGSVNFPYHILNSQQHGNLFLILVSVSTKTAVNLIFRYLFQDFLSFDVHKK